MIPALYQLGRELYDRRTGLIAAAFGAVSPLLVWYSQEVRMYAFVTLFGLLALLHAAAGRSATPASSTGRLHPRHRRAPVVALLRPAADRRAAADLRRRADPPALAAARAGPAPGPRLRLLGRGAGDAARPALVFAHSQFNSTARGGRARRAGPTTTLSFYAVVSNMAWALWGYHPDSDDRAPRRDVAAVAAALAAPARPRRVAPDDAPRASPRSCRSCCCSIVAAFDRELFEVRYFLIVVPLLLLLRRAARHRLDPQPAARDCSSRASSP